MAEIHKKPEYTIDFGQATYDPVTFFEFIRRVESELTDISLECTPQGHRKVIRLDYYVKKGELPDDAASPCLVVKLQKVSKEALEQLCRTVYRDLQ